MANIHKIIQNCVLHKSVIYFHPFSETIKKYYLKNHNYNKIFLQENKPISKTNQLTFKTRKRTK